MSVVRLVLWNIGDSMTSVAELRAQMPEPEGAEHGLWNEAGERFGLLAFDEEIEAVRRGARLIGKEPDAAEEFDA